jgi:hypothetical protein
MGWNNVFCSKAIAYLSPKMEFIIIFSNSYAFILAMLRVYLIDSVSALTGRNNVV